ncbi:C40 family peptidase [Metabacillus iocasae]|uniref:Cell wall-associated NlpC family hydrolase n=1 Tax=Priestia iocasae TaxID=2291674 RepID=A0ABS2QUG9_9BACI|nr:C40 family peptidase [Metabacillus iocasae]MBM7703055.1 cell wall-associated NlpC family hydrolase [Metabacillus iocasae]
MNIRKTVVAGIVGMGLLLPIYEGHSFVETTHVEAAFDSSEVVSTAKSLLGTPYLFGGETPSGFDCSGFVQYVFESVGVYLPRSTDQQWQVGESITKSNLQAGDVVFFSNTYREGISHSGIYLGNDEFIHAHSERGIEIARLTSSYWTEKYTGAKRYEGLDVASESAIVKESMKHIGTEYKKGGTTSEGFDTSGFVQYVFKEAKGMDIPRYADSQWAAGDYITKDKLEIGDIVFFQTSILNPAIYIGGDYVIHVTLSEGVRITNYKVDSYWADKYAGAKRITNEK